MIKIENTVTPSDEQWEAVIKGVRNPFNSWNKSDSEWRQQWEWLDNDHQVVKKAMTYSIGDADLKLMATLARAGDDHGKFLRMLPVICDITAPVYWLAELDTYKVSTVRNSTSLMHTAMKHPYTIRNFSVQEELYDVLDPIRETKTHNILNGEKCENAELFELAQYWEDLLAELNELRDLYLETKDDAYFFLLRQIMPMSYNYHITWSANYQVLKRIYHSRKNHKLREWECFRAWITTLPYSSLITGENDGNKD